MGQRDEEGVWRWTAQPRNARAAPGQPVLDGVERTEKVEEGGAINPAPLKGTLATLTLGDGCKSVSALSSQRTTGSLRGAGWVRLAFLHSEFRRLIGTHVETRVDG